MRTIRTSNERRLDRKNETPYGTHARDERRDDIGGTSNPQSIKEIKHTGEKHQINTFIARPPHRLLPIACGPQIAPRPRAGGREGGGMDSKQIGFAHPMGDCRHIATCPTPSSNGVHETRTTRRGGEGKHRPRPCRFNQLTHRIKTTG